MTMINGPAFSITVLDAEQLPAIPKHLLPWLLKDRREAVDGSTFYNTQTKEHQHDRMGLTYAERELRRIKVELEQPSNSADRNAILALQFQGQEASVEFWRGKIYLLDKMIAAAQAAPS